MPNIAKIVVEVAVDREFDYRVPEHLRDSLQVGSQVVVPFGHSEARGYVVGLTDHSERDDLKEIRSRVGTKSLVSEPLMALARWMAEYYVAPVEHAVRAVLPGAVRRRGAGFKERLFVLPTDSATDELAVEQLRRRAPKQAAVLDVLLSGGQMFAQHLARSAGTSVATVRALEKKGFVRMGRQAVARDPFVDQTIIQTQPLSLTATQARALELAKQSIDTLLPPVLLLHGVTGSGKTEIYLQAIQHALDQGRGAIVLVPEIALTPQTLERFRARFGSAIAVLHSHLSEGERHDEWHRVHEGHGQIVVGARSALFAPVKRLGLIVVDEEHEPTYKQEESPRYNARDVAVMRGRTEACAVLLGSATPSLESYANAVNGKYGLAEMPARVDNRQMPVMRVIDMRTETEREGKVHIISRELEDAIRERIARAEQTLLFLNRRGFATSLICPKCGHVAECDACSVAMTYHKKVNRVKCHLCGADRSVPERCPNPECQDPGFRFAGMGTQKIEEIVRKLFPRARVQRMDSDSMTRKDAYRQVLGDFRTGRIDILVGTQMIAKGLHFPNVTLVGVVFADLSLHMPDFRAGERTFQLLTQVAGRAGRGEILGEVIVQTYTPFHPAVQSARRLNFQEFFNEEIEFRRELGYPPRTHLTCVTVRGPAEEKVAFTADAFAQALKPLFGPMVQVGGPSPAPLARIKGQYRYQLIMRAPRTKQVTEPLREVLKEFRWPKGIQHAVDVDALTLL